MKIVFVSIWYSENMGYIENFLPQALARNGHEVHILTSTAQVYFDQPFYAKTYEKFLGPPIVKEGVYSDKGVTIHRLPFTMILKKRIHINNLISKINEMQPDIVHSLNISDYDTLLLAFAKLSGAHFKLFGANHNGTHALFPTEKAKQAFTWRKKMKWRLQFTISGRFISWFTEKCFAATTDAADIARDWYGVQKKKIKVTPLGVDTTQFYPDENKRNTMRKQLGYAADEIVCIHTGKLTDFKNPLLLAEAVKILNEKYNLPFRGLFVGEGEQAEKLEQQPYCKLLPFQKHSDLPNFYRSSDLAVWHLSVTNSFFDAVACGLPLVCGDDVDTYAGIGSAIEKQPFDAYRVRIVSRFCKVHDLNDLVEKLKNLSDTSVRSKLSREGLKEIELFCSWDSIARARILDYEMSLK